MILHSLSDEEFDQRIEDAVARVLAKHGSQAPTIPSKLIPEKAAASLLGISKSTLERRRKAGLITYVKNGERPFYKQEHLDTYLKEIRLRGTRFQ